MILYTLRCTDAHEFEAWFPSSTAYETQADAGQLVCPHCGSRNIEKAMMAPSVSGTRSPLSQEEARKLRRGLAELRKYVLDNGEDVGKAFPEEVRKIHYGETEKRQIYGEASLKEAHDLSEEGIDIVPLPPDIDETLN